MKHSQFKELKTPFKRNLSFQPLTTLDYNNQNRRVTFIDPPQTEDGSILERKLISRKNEAKSKSKLKQSPNESKKLTEQISLLKQNLKEGRNYRKMLLQQIQNSAEKQNSDIFNSTFTQGFKYDNQTEKVTNIFLEKDFFKNTVIADSFLGSFKAVFSFYVELYFQKMTLAQQLKEKHLTVFSYLARYLDYKLIDSKTLIEVDSLCLAIYRLIRSKEANYKIVDIKYGMNKYFEGKSLLFGKQFASVFQTSQKNSYLTNPSKSLMSLTIEEIMKAFFQIFAQFYDTEIKFKKICKANQQKLMNLIAKLSNRNELNIKLLAEFLYFDVQKSKNWLVLRFQEFFKDHFGSKVPAFKFLKWIKQNR